MSYTEWNPYMFNHREYWLLRKTGNSMLRAVAAWVSEYGTDGYVSTDDFEAIATKQDLSAKKALSRMLVAGVLFKVDGGYQLVVEAGVGRDNYLYCPSIAEPQFRFRPSAHQSGPRRKIPESVRQFVLDRDGHACLVCGTKENLAMDHIVPWSRGGSDRSTNLQTLCGRCNSQKSDRVP